MMLTFGINQARIYLSYYYIPLIQRYSPTGKLITSFCTSDCRDPDGNGLFSAGDSYLDPEDFDVDLQNNIYTLDVRNNQIQIFR
jgi:hypothetical protein